MHNGDTLLHRGSSSACLYGAQPAPPELCDLLSSIGHNQSVFQNFLSRHSVPDLSAIGCVIVWPCNVLLKQAAARFEALALNTPRRARRARPAREGEWNEAQRAPHDLRIARQRETFAATDPQARLLAPGPWSTSLCSNDEIVNFNSQAAGRWRKAMGLSATCGHITDREGSPPPDLFRPCAPDREDFAACAMLREAHGRGRDARLNKTADSSMEDWERCRWRIRRFRTTTAASRPRFRRLGPFVRRTRRAGAGQAG